MRALILLFLMVFIVACSDDQLGTMQRLSEGAQLYQSHCANCHQEDGSGLARLIPPLKDSDYLRQHPEKLPCIIMNGMKGRIKVNNVEYNLPMPAEIHLNKDKMISLTKYVLYKFAPDQPYRADTTVIYWMLACKS